MAKFNTGPAAVGAGLIQSEQTPSGRTYEGAPGYGRDLRGELFLLGVANMVGEDTFYETARARDSRFTHLVRRAAVSEFEWLTGFARWLRSGNMLRSAPLVIAAEATKARLDAGLTGSRAIVSAVLARPDEPGEFLAYWHSHFGRKLPKPVKRGVADAVSRLYTERAFLKWDSDARAYRFGDVIRLVHPAKSELFRYAISTRLGVDGLEVPERLTTIAARERLRRYTPEEIRAYLEAGLLPEMLRTAGMTWEAVPALVDGPWTKALWEAVIPTMGYMALARNLRNFDEAGVSDAVAQAVAAKLADPGEVARSKQLPMRFLSAYRAAPSLRWGHPLSLALEASVSNIPHLPGRTLILVDTSGSMNAGFSKDGTLARWDAATLFGLALARRCEQATVVSFSDRAIHFEMLRGEPLLRALERWVATGYMMGGGTYTRHALEGTYSQHDRVVILTDEQTNGWSGNPADVIPAHVPMYTWNLAGYRYGHAASEPNRYTFGGLTDAGFALIPRLERGRDAQWPWETAT